jgi:hypothetical protein
MLFERESVSTMNREPGQRLLAKRSGLVTMEQ